MRANNPWLIIGILIPGAFIGWYTGTLSALLNLENAARLAEVVTAFSIVVGIIGLREDRRQREYRREQDQALSVAEQVGMFRKEILPLLNDAQEDIKIVKKETSLEYTDVVNIEEFSIRWLLEKRPRETLLQQIFWNAAQKLELGENWAFKPQALLNALEEFSIKVRASGTIENPELRSIHRAFVYCVETFVWPMVLTAPYDKNMYPAVKYVYEEWSKKISRIPVEDIKQRVGEDVKAAAENLRKVMSTEEYAKLRFALTPLIKNPSTSPKKPEF